MADVRIDPGNAAPLDDVDRLFAHLERVEPPSELTARVLRRTVQPRTATSTTWPWLVAFVAAVGVLAYSGYLLGVQLASTSGLFVVEALADDFSLLLAAPGDVLSVFGDLIPWQLVFVAGLSAAVLTWTAGRLVGHVTEHVPAMA